MKVSEPTTAYNTAYLQGLKNRLIASIDAMNDEQKLQECLDLLHKGTAPCQYTEEELDEIVRTAEKDGFATQKEVDEMFAKWRS